MYQKEEEEEGLCIKKKKKKKKNTHTHTQKKTICPGNRGQFYTGVVIRKRSKGEWRDKLLLHQVTRKAKCAVIRVRPKTKCIVSGYISNLFFGR